MSKLSHAFLLFVFVVGFEINVRHSLGFINKTRKGKSKDMKKSEKSETEKNGRGKKVADPRALSLD